MARFPNLLLASISALHFSIAAGLPNPSSDAVGLSVVKRAPHASSQTRSIQDIVAKDKARITSYQDRAGAGDTKRTVYSGSIINENDAYVAPVTICGSTFDLLIDTGSANTWVGGGKALPAGCGTCSKTEPFSVSYGSGTVSGYECTVPVTFGGVTFTANVGSATSSSGFAGIDGVLGLGPTDLTEGTVSGVSELPTVTDSLYSSGKISAEVVSLFFQPLTGNQTEAANGELSFGGVDTSKYTGSLTYSPICKTSPYNLYWSVTVSKVNYGTTSAGASFCAIVDSGTTLIYYPTSVYSKILSGSGGKTDTSSGLPHWTTKPTGNIVLTINGATLTLTPNDYLIPTAQYSYYGLGSGYYGWFGDGGSTAADVNFIIGEKFLEYFYSVYDTTNSRVGFAVAA